MFQFHAFLDLNNKLVRVVCLKQRCESKLASRTGVFSRIGMLIYSNVGIDIMPTLRHTNIDTFSWLQAVWIYMGLYSFPYKSSVG